MEDIVEKKIQEKYLRKIFLGFINIHILRHASKKPFFGSWLMEHLEKHGYKVSPGMVYPILHKMEEEGVLKTEKIKEDDGKIRIYYSITETGLEILEEAENQVLELAKNSKIKI